MVGSGISIEELSSGILLGIDGWGITLKAAFTQKTPILLNLILLWQEVLKYFLHTASGSPSAFTDSLKFLETLGIDFKS